MATAPTVHHVDHEIWIMPLEWLAASDNTLKSKEHTDFIALGQLAQAIGKLRHQIKLLGMLGQAYVKVVKGKPYLIFKGTVNARPLQGTRYLRENPKVACFVIGTKELVKDALEATRIAVFAYVAIDVMKECLMDRFSLARLGINLSSDIFQAAVSTVIGVGFGALVASAAAVAVPLVVIYTVVVATGFIASWGLNALDNQYNLTQNLVDYAVTKEKDSKSFLYKAENTGFRIWRETVGMMQVKDNMLRAALSEQ